MNWRVKRMLVCAAVGVVMGIVMILGGAISHISPPLQILTVFPALPIGVNLFYWGWIMTNGFLRKMNLFLVMTLTKWIIFYLVLAFLSCFVGYVAFPIAIYKAVKNED